LIFVIGDLIRTSLIQIQKAKVDLELAMSALDKLLRANELNFAILTVIPTLAILWIGWRWAASKWRGDKRKGKVVSIVKASLR